MDRIRKMAKKALNYLDSIIEIFNTTEYCEFVGTKNNKKINCRVYNDGRITTKEEK